MLKKYHNEICRSTLENKFSARALRIVIKSNLAQDSLSGQVGHPEFHFDNNEFKAGYAYLESQRQIIWDTIKTQGDPKHAWKAFGRLIHTTQDFYAHTNYIQLWAGTYTPDQLPPISRVEPLKSDILNHPDLRSGQVYLWDWLAFVPGFYQLAHRILPVDSHTHMNLDSPNQGPLFYYAFEAARKRTLYELGMINKGMSSPERIQFKGR